MVFAYILLGVGVLLDVYFILRVRYIKRTGKIISGRVVGKELYDDFEIRRYLDAIEYTTTSGVKGTTKAKINGGNKRKGIGREVQLYEFTDKGKIKVRHITVYLHKLYTSMLFTVSLLILLIMETN